MTEAERRKVEDLLQAIDQDLIPDPPAPGKDAKDWGSDRQWVTFEVLKRIGLL